MVRKIIFAGMSLVLITAVMAGFIGGAQPARAAETVVYSEGFESTNGGYTPSGTANQEWEWGTPAVGVGPGAANSGIKCWGTDLDGAAELNRITALKATEI